MLLLDASLPGEPVSTCDHVLESIIKFDFATYIDHFVMILNCHTFQ